MARDLSVIQAEITAARTAKPELADLDGPTAVADYSLWEEVYAYCIWLFEKLLDAFRVEINTEITNNKVTTKSWWHNQVLNFQYDPTTAQVIEEIDFIAQYPVVDPTLRIITRCAVRNVPRDGHLVVSVKVAQTVDDALVPLNDTQLAALVDYTLAIRPAGISMEVISLYADRLKLVADIYYLGQYDKDLVKAAVIQAINDYFSYLSNEEFDGLVRLLKLEDFIQAVPGVSDIVIHLAQGRDEATPVDGDNVVVFDRVYYTSAGYIIAEDTVGHTLADTLNMIADV